MNLKSVIDFQIIIIIIIIITINDSEDSLLRSAVEFHVFNTAAAH